MRTRATSPSLPTTTAGGREGSSRRHEAVDRAADSVIRAVDAFVPIPQRGRTFSGRRRVRLTDMDPSGRVRLDALARFLQDVAIDDVDETGWGVPEHLWFVRRIRADVLAPFLEDREVELVTWCSGVAAVAGGGRGW